MKVKGHVREILQALKGGAPAREDTGASASAAIPATTEIPASVVPEESAPAQSKDPAKKAPARKALAKKTSARQ